MTDEPELLSSPKSPPVLVSAASEGVKVIGKQGKKGKTNISGPSGGPVWWLQATHV